MKIFMLTIFFVFTINVVHADGFDEVSSGEDLLKKCASYIDDGNDKYIKNDAEFCKGFFQGVRAGILLQDRSEFEGICYLDGDWERDDARYLAELFVKYTKNNTRELRGENGFPVGYLYFVTEFMKEKFPCTNN